MAENIAINVTSNKNSVIEGDTVTFTVTVTNNNPFIYHDLNIANLISINSFFKNVFVSTGSLVAYFGGYVWILDLNPNQSATFTAVVQAIRPSPLTFNAGVLINGGPETVGNVIREVAIIPVVFFDPYSALARQKEKAKKMDNDCKKNINYMHVKSKLCQNRSKNAVKTNE